MGLPPRPHASSKPKPCSFSAAFHHASLPLPLAPPSPVTLRSQVALEAATPENGCLCMCAASPYPQRRSTHHTRLISALLRHCTPPLSCVCAPTLSLSLLQAARLSQGGGHASIQALWRKRRTGGRHARVFCGNKPALDPPACGSW
jgi:hypothetical protein